jgi:hypothetical protein
MGGWFIGFAACVVGQPRAAFRGVGLAPTWRITPDPSAGVSFLAIVLAVDSYMAVQNTTQSYG